MITANGFINRTAELEFILTKTDGVLRCNLLNIKRIHYKSKEHADEWFNKINQETANCSDEAKAALRYMHDIMTYTSPE